MSVLRRIGSKFFSSIKYGSEEPSTKSETDSGYESVAKDDTASPSTKSARRPEKSQPKLIKAKSMSFAGLVAETYRWTVSHFDPLLEDLPSSSQDRPRYPRYETPKKHRSLGARMSSSLSRSGNRSGKISTWSSRKRRAAIPDYEQDQFHSPLSQRQASSTEKPLALQYGNSPKSPADASKVEIALNSIKSKDQDQPVTPKKQIGPQLLWERNTAKKENKDDPYVDIKQEDSSKTPDPPVGLLKTTIEKASAISKHNSVDKDCFARTSSNDEFHIPDDCSLDSNNPALVPARNVRDLREYVQDKKIPRGIFKDKSSDFLDDRRSLPSYKAGAKAEDIYAGLSATFKAAKFLPGQTKLSFRAHRLTDQKVEAWELVASPPGLTATKLVRFENSDGSLRSSFVAEDGYQDDDNEIAKGMGIDSSPTSAPNMGSREFWESSRAERAKRYAEIIYHENGNGFPSRGSTRTEKSSKTSPLRHATEAIERPSSLQLGEGSEKENPGINASVVNKDHGKDLLEKARQEVERTERAIFEEHDKHGKPSVVLDSKPVTSKSLDKLDGVASWEEPSPFTTPKPKNVQALKSSSPIPLLTPPETPPEDKIVIFLMNLKNHTSDIHNVFRSRTTSDMAAHFARERAQKLAMEEFQRLSMNSQLEESLTVVSIDSSQVKSSRGLPPSEWSDKGEADKSAGKGKENQSAEKDKNNQPAEQVKENELVGPTDAGKFDSSGFESSSIDEKKRRNRMRRLATRKEGRKRKKAALEARQKSADRDSEDKNPPAE